MLRSIARNVAATALTLSLSAAPVLAAPVWGDTNLYIFQGGISGPDGGTPISGVIQGTDGNYYGTTWYGGTGGGTVFRVTPSGTETIVYAFSGSADGQQPFKLVQGANGNFYGTTLHGGGTDSDGIVFEVTPEGQETILQSFANNGGPAMPAAGLTLGKDGNFYGTSSGGGASGAGTFFKMTPAGVLTVLGSFGGSIGGNPHGELIEGTEGVFYGTTASGGDGGYGTVFEVTTTGVFTVLHTFAGGDDGAQPNGPLLRGHDGNLYGMTQAGGSGACAYPGLPNGCGTVYKVTTAGVETVLHQFAGYPTDGANPQGGLVQASNGTLYGSTTAGGYTDPGNCSSGCGIIFSMTTAGVETILISFGIAGDEWYLPGWSPSGSLLLGADDTLIGTTQNGGGGWGDVIEISPIPVVHLTATPNKITFGQSTTLTWSTTHAQSCEASGAWSGTEPLTGTQSVTPDAEGRVGYDLTCSGPGGTTAATAVVTVAP